MTENEYEKLGKQQIEITSETDKAVVPGAKKETRRAAKATEDSEKLRPISLKMLQGAFYLLLIGHAVSGKIFIKKNAYVLNYYYRSYINRWVLDTQTPKSTYLLQKKTETQFYLQKRFDGS